MAPLIAQLTELAKRRDGYVQHGASSTDHAANNASSCGSGGYRDYDGVCRYYSSWYWWGRWVFAGLAVLFIILVFAGLLYVYPRVVFARCWEIY